MNSRLLSRCFVTQFSLGFALSLSVASSQSLFAQETTEIGSKEITGSTFDELLKEKDYDRALEHIEELRSRSFDDKGIFRLEQKLAMTMMRDQPKKAAKLLSTMVNRLLETKELDTITELNLISSTSYWVQIASDLSDDEKIAAIDKTLSKVNYPSARLSVMTVRTLLSIKARFLLKADRTDEAKSMIDEAIQPQRSLAVKGDRDAITKYLSLVTWYSSMLKRDFADEVAKLEKEAGELSESLVADDRLADITANEFSAYFGFKSAGIAAGASVNAFEAEKNLERLGELLAKVESNQDEKESSQFASMRRSFNSLRLRVESSVQQQRLIGTVAPEIDAVGFVGIEPCTMEHLRGKVVLLDFGAVWCGPCIATFPHLIDWHDRYANQGLVVLGATRQYNYRWNEEAARPERVASKDEDGNIEKVSLEEEIGMLEKFRSKYELRHGFFVTPEKSGYHKSFGVTGIPHAVLIDKEGRIQMIRVGSGEDNAKALEEKIVALLQ